MFVCSNIIADVAESEISWVFFEPTEEKHTNLTQTVHLMKRKNKSQSRVWKWSTGPARDQLLWRLTRTTSFLVRMFGSWVRKSGLWSVSVGALPPPFFFICLIFSYVLRYMYELCCLTTLEYRNINCCKPRWHVCDFWYPFKIQVNYLLLFILKVRWNKERERDEMVCSVKIVSRYLKYIRNAFIVLSIMCLWIF